MRRDGLELPTLRRKTRNVPEYLTYVQKRSCGKYGLNRPRWERMSSYQGTLSQTSCV
ncbi:hypothetical protein C8Q75DRAFT_744958 [Abortiporus biennis]|nr:hypothetical protein C8Q75DRAFT_744958 [Abortiporus biennis]